MVLLADCERAVGDSAAAIGPRKRGSASIPAQQRHQHLADHYRRQGNAEKAAYHQRRAVP